MDLERNEGGGEEKKRRRTFFPRRSKKMPSTSWVIELAASRGYIRHTHLSVSSIPNNYFLSKRASSTKSISRRRDHALKGFRIKRFLKRYRFPYRWFTTVGRIDREINSTWKRRTHCAFVSWTVMNSVTLLSDSSDPHSDWIICYVNFYFRSIMSTLYKKRA